MHPNPNVRKELFALLSKAKLSNVILCDPLPYEKLLFCIKHAKLILTDSGGIQEEAPSFHCPILVLRKKTERMEGVKAGFAKLVGTNTAKIIKEASKILQKDKALTRIYKESPYGDSYSSEKISQIIERFFNV